MFRLVILSLLLLGVARGFDCPPPCECFPDLADPNSVTIDCRGRELLELPYPIPETTSHLDVSGNEIQFIRAADFPSGGLPRLRFLQLQNNNLMDIESGALARLPNLQVLLLFNNRIPAFRSGVFDGLPNLQILDAYNIDLEEVNSDLFADLQNIVDIDLSFNLLEEIPTQTFNKLPRLQRLSLNDNFITNLETIAFYNLPTLRFLNLASNQLRSITPRAFTRIKNIRSISLQGNPTECGCDAIWLLDFLQKKRLQGPECVNPAELRGEQLVQLNVTVICRFPTADVIGSQEIVVFNGTDIVLGCDLSGAPFPMVTWSRDGATLDLDDERIVVNGSTLFVMDAQVEDSGRYFCIAISTAGEVAAVARVTVVDRLEQDNMTTGSVVGTDVLLDCTPGLPLGIQVMWEFGGVPLVPSAKHMFLRNGSLVVLSAELSDIGDYVCVVDGVVLLRELELVAVPAITDFPEGPCTEPSVVTLDTSIFQVPFPCTAFGIPAPTVVWTCQAENCFRDVVTVPPDTPDGGSTTATYDFFFPAPEQSGNYTCTATNERGSVSRSVTVEIIVIGAPAISLIIEQRHFVGETIVLLCDPERAFTDPTTQFSWRRFEGIPLPPDRAEFQGRNSTLILRDLVSPGDIAQYICTIEQLGVMPSTITYAISIFEFPLIERVCPVPVVAAMVDRSVTLECDARGNPPVMVEWLLNGTSINDVISPNRTQFADGNQLLTISSLEERDSGRYKCTATNQFGNDSFVQQLAVQIFPFFRFRPERVAVTAGQLVRLWCGGEGNPPPTVRWFMAPHKTLGPFSEVTTSEDARVLVTEESLVIVAASVADQGKYFCIISSSLGSRMSSTAFLRVYTPPIIPPLPTEFRASVGRRHLVFDCFGSGDPAPVTNWIRDRATILPITGRHVQLANGSLVIIELREEDAGEYRCRVANVGGADYLDVVLTVDALPETRVQPAFLQTDVGCQAIFLCLDGTQQPDSTVEIEWSFSSEDSSNETSIAPSERFLLRPSGELVITDLQFSDTGDYTCNLTTPAGNVTATAGLVVVDPLFFNSSIPLPPTITFHSPEEVVSAEGLVEVFQCQADGFPEPVFSWFIDGEPAQGVAIDNGALSTRALSIENEGVYTCVASNALGSDSQNFSLSIAWRPEIVVAPVAMALREFETLRLDCMAEGFPEPSITWLFNQLEIVPDDRILVFPNGTLVVFNVRSEGDAGSYSCLARNMAGDTESAVPVTVGPVLVAPNITEPPESIVVATGEAVVLDCIVTGVPLPEVTWLMNGLPLVTVDNISVVIATAVEEDEGSYTCIAENEAGRAVYTVFVTVETVEQQLVYPMFVTYPTSRWVVNGSLVEVECSADGVPPPSISWLVDSEPLVETESLFVDGNGTLVVVEATENNTGVVYTCRASNEAGVNQVSVGIDLTEEGRRLLPPGTGEGEGAPFLTSYPVGLLSLLPQERVVLDCLASGRPTPLVVWLRDGVALDVFTDPNLQLLLNGSLVVREASGQDEGLYSCIATNDAGSSEVHVQIEVRGGRVIGSGQVPEFTLLPQDTTSLAGSKVTADCQARGSPEPYIIWTNGSRPVYESSRVKLAPNGSLVLLSVWESDAGSYTCRAANRAGAKEASIQIAVLPRREPPFFTARPEGVVDLQGGHFTLHCAASSTAGGTVNIEWSYGGRPVVGGGERFELLLQGELLVTNTVPEDSGEYTCIARNAFGVSSSSTTVRILRFPINSTSQVLEGSTVMLECEGGEGGEGVTWKKDGGPLPRRSVVHDGTLWLFGAAVSDEGEYSCSGPQTSGNHLLQVHVAPSIAHKSTLVVVATGDTAALHCVPEGRPRPLLSWQRDGVLLERDGTHSILSNGTLVMYGSSEREAGVYVCRVESEAGSVHTSVLLQVYGTSS